MDSLLRKILSLSSQAIVLRPELDTDEMGDAQIQEIEEEQTKSRALVRPTREKKPQAVCPLGSVKPQTVGWMMGAV